MPFKVSDYSQQDDDGIYSRLPPPRKYDRKYERILLVGPLPSSNFSLLITKSHRMIGLAIVSDESAHWNCDMIDAKVEAGRVAAYFQSYRQSEREYESA